MLASIQTQVQGPEPFHTVDMLSQSNPGEKPVTRNRQTDADCIHNIRSCPPQQSDVVRVNTGLKVGHYCGEMGVDFWDHATWVKEFEENEVG